MDLSSSQLNDLRRARELLSNPGLASRLISVLGVPIEKGFALLPPTWGEVVHRASEAALMRALDVAVRSLGDRPGPFTSERLHKIAAAASGAAGGAFGLAALPVELPVSTTIMLRSIADIAKSEGEDARVIDTKLACLTVFALGGGTKPGEAGDSNYFAVRAALAAAINEASSFLAQRGLGQTGAPALLRLISVLAARFGVIVSEKAAAQAVPIVGAAGGALINTIFIGHFQDVARGHFIIRRLEKACGSEPVRSAYETL